MLFRKLLTSLFIIMLTVCCANGREIVIKDKLFITTMNDIYTNLEEEYADDIITFEGNLQRGEFDDPEFEGKEFPFVYRLGPGCCYNDSYAGMYIDYDGEIPPDNTWVRVSGHAVYFEHNGFTELFLKADSITVMDKPGMLTVKD